MEKKPTKPAAERRSKAEPRGCSLQPIVRPFALDKLHPQLSVYMLELLNDWSNTLRVEREYDEDSGEFFVSLKAKFTDWMEDGDGKRVLISDAVVTAWRMDSREQMDELLRLLEHVRDQVWPNAGRERPAKEDVAS